MEQPSLDLEKHPVGDTIQEFKEYNHALVGGNTINNNIPTYAFVWTKHTSPDATSASGTLVHGDEVCDILTKNVSNLVIQQYAKPKPPPEPPPHHTTIFFIFLPWSYHTAIQLNMELFWILDYYYRL